MENVGTLVVPLEHTRYYLSENNVTLNVLIKIEGKIKHAIIVHIVMNSNMKPRRLTKKSNDEKRKTETAALVV